MTKLKSFATSSKMNLSYRYGSKILLRELARVWEKDIDDIYDIDWEVKFLPNFLPVGHSKALNT